MEPPSSWKKCYQGYFSSSSSIHWSDFPVYKYVCIAKKPRPGGISGINRQVVLTLIHIHTNFCMIIQCSKIKDGSFIFCQCLLIPAILSKHVLKKNNTWTKKEAILVRIERRSFSLFPLRKIWGKQPLLQCRPPPSDDNGAESSSVSYFGNGTLALRLIPLRPPTDSESNVSEHSARRCDRLRRESVARFTANIPVKSDICFQSNPLSSLQQLPWKPQCHFPHCLDRSISWKLFQSPALLKVGRMAVRACFAAVFLSLRTACICKALAALSWWFSVCACTQVQRPMIECVCVWLCGEGLRLDRFRQNDSGGCPSLDLYIRQTWTAQVLHSLVWSILQQIQNKAHQMWWQKLYRDVFSFILIFLFNLLIVRDRWNVSVILWIYLTYHLVKSPLKVFWKVRQNLRLRSIENTFCGRLTRLMYRI